MDTMWLHMATGFTGGLTLVFLLRALYRKFTDTPTVTAYFSPGGGCTDAVVAQLNKARREVLVLAHKFASEPLAKAVLDAKLRGATVEMLCDKRCELDTASSLHAFAEQGLAPFLDRKSACAHNNVILIDGRVLITGSFDFTKQAEEEHADNLLIVTGYPELVGAYRKKFAELKGNGVELRATTAENADKKAA